MADNEQIPANWVTPCHGWRHSCYAVTNTGSIGTANLALNKTTSILRVPKGFQPTDIRIDLTDMDSDTALVVTVGDAGYGVASDPLYQAADYDRLVTVNTTGQTGGSITALASTGFLYKYPAETDIILTVTTAAGTPVAGTFKAALFGKIE